MQSMTHTLFLKKDAVFLDDTVPILADGTVESRLKGMKVNFTIFLRQHSHYG
jgi:hypothetical protein